MSGGRKPKRPPYDDQLGRRISEVAALFGTKKDAARVALVSTMQLSRWEKGESSPPLEAMVRLTAAKGVSLNWLATGEGPMRAGEAPLPEQPAPPAPPSPPTDTNDAVVDEAARVIEERSPPPSPHWGGGSEDDVLVEEVAGAIEELYKERGERLTIKMAASLAARKSAEIAAASADPAERRVMIKLMVVLLRAEMTDAANDRLSAKQRA